MFLPPDGYLLILYVSNEASPTIMHEINWSLEMRYCKVPLYVVTNIVDFWYKKMNDGQSRIW